MQNSQTWSVTTVAQWLQIPPGGGECAVGRGGGGLWGDQWDATIMWGWKSEWMGFYHFLEPTVNSIYDGARRLGINQPTETLAFSPHSSHKPGLVEYKKVGFLFHLFSQCEPKRDLEYHILLGQTLQTHRSGPASTDNPAWAWRSVDSSGAFINN